MEQADRKTGGSKLGVATTSYMMAWKPDDTLEFLEHCHSLGAAGIQSPISGGTRTIRERAEEYGMYIEAFVPLPEPNGDTTGFEQALKAAKAVGATAMRAACLATRRYETFHSDAAWQQHVAQSKAMIEAARPILDRYKIPLGVENHKDWTCDELAGLMQQYATEYLGVCLDFGNNLSLMDDPTEAIEKLAPYAVCVHLKDMGTAPDADGFLLSEVPLGEGFIDLAADIATVRRHRPDIQLSLEMITRDPLKVPCLDDSYWVTFRNRSREVLPGVLQFVNSHAYPTTLPTISKLSNADWVKAENDNVITCLKYGREHLDL